MKKIITLSLILFSGMRVAAQSCTPVALPYNENFDGLTAPALPACTEVADEDNDGYVWKIAVRPQEPARNGKSLYAQGIAATTAAQADDWFYTKPMELEDSLYQLRFAYTGIGATAAGTGTGVAALDVWFGTAKHPDSMRLHPVVFDSLSLQGDLERLDTVIVYFKPSRPGIWYIGFHSKIEEAADLYIDDIRVERAPGDYVKDISLLGFIEPVDSLETCPDNNLTVRVSVFNNGIDTLYDVPFHLRTTGAAIRTIQTVRNGALAPGVTDTVIFTGLDLSIPGDYTLIAYAAMLYDEEWQNDTLTQTAFVAPLPAGDGIQAVSGGALSYDFSVINPRDITDYEWDFGDGNTDNGPAPSHTYAANGFYTVTVTLVNDCGTSTLSYSLDTRVGVARLSPEMSAVQVYPNPAREMLTVRTAPGQPIRECIVYNSVGSMVYRAPVAGDRHQVQTAAWPAGYYLMHLRSEEGYVTRKFEIIR
jgi:hypothetical protein